MQKATVVKKRCLICNKKLGLVGGFTCKCGGLFCGLHRERMIIIALLTLLRLAKKY